MLLWWVPVLVIDRYSSVVGIVALGIDTGLDVEGLFVVGSCGKCISCGEGVRGVEESE